MNKILRYIVYNYSKAKKRIENRLKDFNALYTLNNNWDDEDSIAPNYETIDFVFNYIRKLAKSTYIHNGEYVDLPDISPLSDGSIDVLFENEKEQSLFNFYITKRSEKINYYKSYKTLK